MACYRRRVISIEAFAGRAILQIAFVVNDLDEALERYSAALQASPWRCYTLSADDHLTCEYPGGPTSFSSRLASMPEVDFVWPRSAEGGGRS